LLKCMYSEISGCPGLSLPQSAPHKRVIPRTPRNDQCRCSVPPIPAPHMLRAAEAPDPQEFQVRQRGSENAGTYAQRPRGQAEAFRTRAGRSCWPHRAAQACYLGDRQRRSPSGGAQRVLKSLGAHGEKMQGVQGSFTPFSAPPFSHPRPSFPPACSPPPCLPWAWRHPPWERRRPRECSLPQWPCSPSARPGTAP